MREMESFIIVLCKGINLNYSQRKGFAMETKDKKILFQRTKLLRFLEATGSNGEP